MRTSSRSTFLNEIVLLTGAVFLLYTITLFHRQYDNSSSNYLAGLSDWNLPPTNSGKPSLRLQKRGETEQSKLKILYVVTTLAEFDDGGRDTKRGNDRLKGILLPVLQEGVESMVSFGYHVDVYVISHYKMRPERFRLIRNALPSSVGLQVWDDAAPLSYNYIRRVVNNSSRVGLRRNNLGFARQHRFVIKDNLWKYDFFVNFEDDMVVKGDHVRNYLQLLHELERLKRNAPDGLDSSESTHDNFYGTMTKWQLQRLIPGLIRVEVLLNESKYGTQEVLDPVPITDRPLIDPQPCCQMSHQTSGKERPEFPHSDQLFLLSYPRRAFFP